MSTQRKPHSDASEDSESSKVVQIGRAAGSAAVSTFHALNDAEPCYTPGARYSTVRHTRPWVYYQGTSTVVPISILGSASLPADRTISLQRRGWRTGLLGWTIGGWVGGTLGKELDVTPASSGHWQTLDTKKKSTYDKEIREFLESTSGPKDHRVLETDFVHIPVSAGDGYFRLLIKKGSGTVIASTASFRIGSLSLSSAHPRGASVVTLVPEIILKSASVTTNTAVWASFYAAFPFLKVAQMLPGTSTWGNYALNRAYKLAGGEQTTAELKERYKVEERRMRAEETVYRNVPFGSVGVRTAYDIQEDARKGKGGIYFPRDT
ncbi:hypothetical protein C8F04DRAFT_1402370 [Mycena alexandri]|uniref:Uncharacterized protein n=1 Tax=Mycena alexandri TaxID=1745969 RepID=A0AAD6SBB6_9AGAR|nr:hypothetical protein C8F04DRAFT_1402370 [Mycena alexandri]